MQLNNKIRTKVLLSLLILNGVFRFLDVIYINQLFKGIESGYEWFKLLEFYEATSRTSVVLLGIIFGCWIYKAHKNLEILGRKDLRFSHASTVWWFFIPVFQFWKPYQVMKEILLKTTENLKDTKVKKVKYILCVYWLITNLIIIYGYFVCVMLLYGYLSGYLIPIFLLFAYLNLYTWIIMNVFSLIGMFCMFYYIYHINHWQQKSKKNVSL